MASGSGSSAPATENQDFSLASPNLVAVWPAREAPESSRKQRERPSFQRTLKWIQMDSNGGFIAIFRDSKRLASASACSRSSVGTDRFSLAGLAVSKCSSQRLRPQEFLCGLEKCMPFACLLHAFCLHFKLKAPTLTRSEASRFQTSKKGGSSVYSLPSRSLETVANASLEAICGASRTNLQTNFLTNLKAFEVI